MSRRQVLSILSTVWALGAVFCAGTPASASPWAEVGDEVLRSDVEILASYGLIDQLLTTWPIPWAQISHRLPADDDSLPAHVRRSLKRVHARLARETAIRRTRVEALTRVTNEPALVRDFATTGRDEIDARARIEYMWRSTALRLSVGYQGAAKFDRGKIAFDDSYLAQEAGNWLLYGGVLDHWWGPGWTASLILSNNPRPFPRVGFMRNNPRPSRRPG